MLPQYWPRTAQHSRHAETASDRFAKQHSRGVQACEAERRLQNGAAPTLYNEPLCNLAELFFPQRPVAQCRKKPDKDHGERHQKWRVPGENAEAER